MTDPGAFLTPEMISNVLEELWRLSWSRKGLATLRDTDDGICTAENPYGMRCQNPAVTILTAGCVHEHVFPSPLCSSCARLFIAEENVCGYCREKGHQCPVEIIRQDPYQPAQG